ncbi:MAG: HlyD family efflux transporter periplasmic adaptor subunit [Bacillota bacterium]
MRDYSRLSSPAKNSKNKFNKRVNWLIKLLLFLILFSLVILVVVNLSGYNSNNVIVASYGTISKQFESEGVLIRDEKVVFTSQSGQVELNTSEGKRVSAGNLIARVNGGNKSDDLYNYEAGIISYKVDGLENTLEVEDISNLGYKKLAKLKGSINAVESGDQVNAGRPIFKVINNFQFYLAILLPQDQLSNYGLADEVEVSLVDLPEQNFNATVYNIILDQPKNIMVLKIDSFLDELVDIRKSDAKVIKRRYHGIVVPSSAIIKENNKTKVRIRGHVKDYTKEVKLKGEIDGKAIIKKGINPGTKVILN